MQPLHNPNQQSIRRSTILLVISLLCTVAGLTVIGGDAGFWMASMGALGLLVALIILPIFIFDGKRKAKELATLLNGDGLLAHWQYSRDEWDRYTEQEHARAMASLRKTGLWTFLGTPGLVLAGGLLGDVAFDSLYFAITFGIALAVTVCIGGAMFMGAQLTLNRNRASVGDVWIGLGGVYFHGQFHSWAVKGVRLSVVELEPRDPTVIHFRYEVPGAESTNYNDVRVPVPHGREEAARAIVSRFHEGG